MKTLQHIVALLVFGMFAIVGNAQTRTVKGIVTGIDGAIEGAKVELLNSKTSVLTGTNGNFSIEISRVKFSE